MNILYNLGLSETRVLYLYKVYFVWPYRLTVIYISVGHFNMAMIIDNILGIGQVCGLNVTRAKISTF